MGGNEKCNFHGLKLPAGIKDLIQEAGIKDVKDLNHKSFRDLNIASPNDEIIKAFVCISKFLQEQFGENGYFSFITGVAKRDEEGNEDWGDVDSHEILIRLLHLRGNRGGSVSVYRHTAENGEPGEIRKIQKEDPGLPDEEEVTPQEDEAVEEELEEREEKDLDLPDEDQDLESWLGQKTSEEGKEMEEKDEKEMENADAKALEFRREYAKLDASGGSAVEATIEEGVGETAEKPKWVATPGREPEDSPLPGVRTKTAQILRKLFGDDVTLEEVSLMSQDVQVRDEVHLYIKGAALLALNKILEAKGLAPIPGGRKSVGSPQGEGEKPRRRSRKLEVEDDVKIDGSIPDLIGEPVQKIFRPLVDAKKEAQQNIDIEAIIEKVLNEKLRPYVEGLEDLVMRFDGLITDTSKLALISKVLAWLNRGDTDAKMKTLECIIGLDASRETKKKDWF